MTDMPYRLDRHVDIEARPGLVFSMLTTTEHWARWWGPGSRIDPVPGGEVLIRHPNGIEVGGEVLEVRAGERLAFTYGYASGAPIPPGGSRVEITLEPRGSSTRLHLRHHFGDEASRDQHVQGWRFQLSLFSNVVADRLHADAATRADAWLATWADPDEASRRRRLEAIASPDLRVQDRFSALEGLEDVLAHIVAAQRFTPGVCMTRDGEVRHCQGSALVDWVASVDGATTGRGTNLFQFDPDGRITRVTGFWSGD
jgi:uncharacterized protein YndB with AHSA1/START domain